MEDSGHAVVKKTEDEKEIVKAGQDYEQVVEGVLHVIRTENIDGECIPNEPKKSNRNLKMNIKENAILILFNEIEFWSFISQFFSCF